MKVTQQPRGRLDSRTVFGEAKRTSGGHGEGSRETVGRNPHDTPPRTQEASAHREHDGNIGAILT